ncbi:hypothetical protein FOZ62_004232 [Perkinsus olseni]|uniref:Uncharacterized protein n=1 Tax=Perkinsus olseni TaxID=32597 RepID=A0A7J6QTY7_PEROL|nr:hypothetical protein FOZ62_004232 [Perkinsus olseni]
MRSIIIEVVCLMCLSVAISPSNPARDKCRGGNYQRPANNCADDDCVCHGDLQAIVAYVRQCESVRLYSFAGDICIFHLATSSYVYSEHTGQVSTNCTEGF